MSDLTILLFESAAAWADWLAENHASSQGVWLKIAKKDSGLQSVTYAEAVDVALCYGWIDSLKRSLDATHFVQKFSPRLTPARSVWSQVNVEKALALIEQGKMQAAGMREVERAQADGRWQAAYAPRSRMMPPADLLEALAQNPVAEANFAQLDGRNRYAVLYRISAAAKPETRARKIAAMVAMLNAGERLYK